MQHSNRWQIIDNLGEGGQGIVYRVIDKNRFDINNKILPTIVDAVKQFSSNVINRGAEIDHFKLFKKALIDIIQMEDSTNH